MVTIGGINFYRVIHIHNIRATGSHIRGTNGTSNGIIPMLKVFNHTARYVDQCLDPEMLVYTKEGPKQIKNIMINDKVITNDGNVNRICKILDNDYEGDLYEIEVKHSISNLKLTDWHPLWTIKNNNDNSNRNFKHIIKGLENNVINPDFIEAMNVSKNDYIGFPVPKYEKDMIEFNEEDCRMYGILIGNGVLDKNNNINYFINFAAYSKNDNREKNIKTNYLGVINMMNIIKYKKE